MAIKLDTLNCHKGVALFLHSLVYFIGFFLEISFSWMKGKQHCFFEKMLRRKLQGFAFIVCVKKISCKVNIVMFFSNGTGSPFLKSCTEKKIQRFCTLLVYSALDCLNEVNIVFYVYILIGRALFAWIFLQKKNLKVI